MEVTWFKRYIFGVLFVSLGNSLDLSKNVGGGEPVYKNDAPSNSIEGIFGNAAVTSDGRPCSYIGKEILKANGSAVDAGIAVQFCLGVTVHESLGIGGGFFFTYYDKASKNVTTMDCREMAPSGASVDMYKGEIYPSNYGGSAVANFGASRCLWILYQKYGGGVPWRNLLSPSINLCENGYPVSAHMAYSLQQKKRTILNETTMSGFVNPATGDVWVEGDILKQPTLGATLRVLQEEPEALNSGSLTSSLLKDLNDLGSTITKQDLNNYQPTWKDPVKVTLQNGGYTVYSLPPPSSGVIFGFILNILDNFNFTTESVSEKNIVTTYQRVTEAFKHAYGRRTLLGDDRFVNVSEIVSKLQSERYAYEIYRNISDDFTSQNPEYYSAATYDTEPSGTSNMAVIDKIGNGLTITSTINLFFGACVTSKSTGIVLNNEMGDFSAPALENSFGLPPSEANFITPGKRPMSSMTPSVITDANGDLVLLTGAAGGTRITSATAWQAMHYLWFGKSLKQSLDAKRLHHQVIPMNLQYENGFRQDIVSKLENIGHNVTEIPSTKSVCTALSVDKNGLIHAMSDNRKSPSSIDGF